MSRKLEFNSAHIHLMSTFFTRKTSEKVTDLPVPVDRLPDLREAVHELVDFLAVVLQRAVPKVRQRVLPLGYLPLRANEEHFQLQAQIQESSANDKQALIKMEPSQRRIQQDLLPELGVSHQWKIGIRKRLLWYSG